MIDDAARPACGRSSPGSNQAPCLIVNADDFGISEPINEGIVLAHRAGIVTAASLMAVGRAFEQALSWCRRVPSLDVGVHLTLVGGRPLSPQGASLGGAGGELPPHARAFVQRYARGWIRQADVLAELRAQIERVLGHGIRVTHLDSHQHLHVLPGIAALTQSLADRYRIPFVRLPLEGLRAGRTLDRHGVARLAGALALRASWVTARLTGARRPPGRHLDFLGFLEGGRLDEPGLQRLLAGLRPGRVYELMCHPGFTPPEPELRSWAYRHEQELHGLTRESIRSAIETGGIRLCGFRDLIPMRGGPEGLPLESSAESLKL